MSKEQNKPGKPWTNVGKYGTYVEAGKVRTVLQTKWEEAELEHMQCKIYRKYDGYLVKIRDNSPDEPKKKTKKKNKKEKVDNG